ncbi:DUF1460 domain-containing protein [Candidatus Sumerlaeota bacterium]|nr:DUF1460 domain-containing protein [Candidatus Sumerlaeota bacterium]
MAVAEDALMKAIQKKPLYKMKPAEVDRYIAYAHETEPDLRKRIAMIGRKNIGQPYQLYLLGEFPYEIYDSQPLFCIEKSDCVVFSEHTYAMALSKDWPTFFRMLQRIRYKNGEIGVASRNHYTEADWDRNNSWLVKDISAELAGDRAQPFAQKIDRARFLKKRYQIDRDIPVQNFKDVYVPWDKVAEIEDQLQEGDFVNVMRSSGDPSSAYAGHVGLIVKGPNGEVHFLHSTPPRVKEQPLSEFIANARKWADTKAKPTDAKLMGFKFLRLEADPIANLNEIDGDAAPRVTPSSYSHVTSTGK